MLDPMAMNAAQQAMMLCTLAHQLDAQALDDAQRAVDRADNVMPVTDPSGWIEQRDDLDDVQTCLEAIRQLRVETEGVDLPVEKA